MSDDQKEYEQAEREMRARVHKHMGWTAMVLVLVAFAVALGRMRAMFGISPWEALGIGSTGLPWVLLIVGIAVIFSLGTTRVMLGIEKVISLFRSKKAGK